MAQRREQATTSRENRPQDFGHHEYVLPVRDRCEDVLFRPVAIGERALLVTAGAEVTCLAGKREQIIVVATRTADVMSTAIQKPFVTCQGET